MKPLHQQIKLQFLLLLCSLQWIIGESTYGNYRHQPSPSSPKAAIISSDRTHTAEKNTDSTFSNDLMPESSFPQHLDLRSLQNIPLVILQPRNPIKLQVLPDGSMPDLQNVLNPRAIYKLIDSGAESSSYSESNRSFQRTPRNHGGFGQGNHGFGHLNHAASNAHVQNDLGKNFLSKIGFGQHLSHNNPGNNGWLGKIKGSFSNMFPNGNLFNARPPLFTAPTANIPSFAPAFGDFNPFMSSNSRPFFTPMHAPMSNAHRWHQFHPMHQAGLGEFSPVASERLPVAATYPWMNVNPMIHHHSFAPHNGMAIHNGGDLFTSASGPIPQRLLPIHGGGFRLPHNGLLASASQQIPLRLPPPNRHNFAKYASKFPRHRPLFHDVEDIGTTSLEINNAFADFTDSHEHGPDVTQRFGSVGDSVSKFLRMMGMGVSGLSMSDIGAFGGAGELASMDSTPLGRSLDFFPGYGNQAHLDHFNDMEIFEEDITHLFPDQNKETTPVSNVEAKKSTASVQLAEKKPAMLPKPTQNMTSKPTSEIPPTPLTYTEKAQMGKQKYNETMKSITSKNPNQQQSHPEMKDHSITMTQGNNKVHQTPTVNTHAGVNAQRAILPLSPNVNYQNLQQFNIRTQQMPHYMQNQHSGRQTDVENIQRGKNENQQHARQNKSQFATNEANAQNKGNQQSQKTHDTDSNAYVQAHHMKNVKSFTGNPKQGPNNNYQNPVYQHATIPKPLYPTVNYKVPVTFSTVSPRDHKTPVIIYKNLQAPVYSRTTTYPPLETSNKTTYVSAHSLSNHQQIVDSTQLIDDDVVRPWVPVNSGKGFVEKRPLDIINSRIPDLTQVVRNVDNTYSGTPQQNYDQNKH